VLFKADRNAFFRTPPQSLLASRTGFDVTTFRSAQEAVEALGRQEVDAAFVWGPVAGYLNRTRLGGAYHVVPVAGDGMQWRIGVGVRKREDALRQRIDGALGELEPQIRRAAERYGFPLAIPLDLAATPAPAAEASAPAPADAVAAGRARTVTRRTPTAPSQREICDACACATARA
jgi:polar amino acid transport system substrate-binding protein